MIRPYLLLAAGVLLSLNAQAADASFDAFMGRVVGNQTTVGFGTGGTPLATSSAGLGTPSTVGNMGLQQAGTGVIVAGEVKAPLGNTGKTVSAVARAPVSRAAFLRGLKAVAGGPAAFLALSVAAPAVVDWLTRGGLSVDPETGVVSKPGESSLPVSDGNEYISLTEKWFLSAAEACSQTYANMTAQIQGNLAICISSDGRPLFQIGRRPSSCPAGHVISQNKCLTPQLTPISWSDIEAYMDRPEAPALTSAVVAQGVTKAGIDPFGAQPANVTVTGPATVPGEKVQTSTQTRVIPGTTTEVGQGYTGETQPATRTTTQAATHNVTYNDNRVTYNTTNNTTTTVTNNVTGQTDTTTEETTTEEDAPDDSITDSPLGDIPKLYERKYPDGMVGIWHQKKAAMQGTSLLAFMTSVMPTGINSGTCPAWTLPVNFGGVMNMGSHPIDIPCWLWGVVKAALIVSALLYARRLIFGG